MCVHTLKMGIRAQDRLLSCALIPILCKPTTYSGMQKFRQSEEIDCLNESQMEGDTNL